MVTIGKLEKKKENGQVKVQSLIKVDGQKDLTVYVGVEPEYEKYLVTERADGFLMGMLMVGLTNGHDITCETPVTSELLFMLETQLIPALVKNDDRFHHVRIFCETEDEPLPNEGAVGTGNSLGVDAFCSIAQNYRAKAKSMRLTHLVTVNHGILAGWQQNNNFRFCAEQLYKREKAVAEELGLPMIKVSSNLPVAIPFRSLYYMTYWLLHLVMSLGKLFGTYLISSAGLGYEQFNVNQEYHEDSALYDLLTLSCASIRGGTRFISSGGELNRREKLKIISEFPVGRDNLIPCLTEHFNCMVCKKCKRNLLDMDAMGILDSFTMTFDIPYYKAHREEYVRYLCEAVRETSVESTLLQGAYEKLKQRDPELIAQFEKSPQELVHELNDLERRRKVLRRYNALLQQALTTESFDEKLKAWLVKRKIHSIIVYGSEKISVAFPLLESLCRKHGITISYVVENQNPKLKYKYPHLRESVIDYPDCDAVVICNVDYPELIRKKLSYFVKAPVFTLEEIIRLKS